MPAAQRYKEHACRTPRQTEIRIRLANRIRPRREALVQRHYGTHTLSALVLAAMLFVAFLVCSPAQSSGNNDVSGVVTGYVYDQYSRPLDRARVFLQSDDGSVSIRTVNRTGFFSFLAVLPGAYVLETRMDGFNICSSAFTIYPNQNKFVRFRLPVALRTLSHVTTSDYNRCRTREPERLVSF